MFRMDIVSASEFVESHTGDGGFYQYARKQLDRMSKTSATKLRISVSRAQFEEAKAILHPYLLSKDSPFDSFKVIDMCASEAKIAKLHHYESELKSEFATLATDIENLNRELSALSPLFQSALQHIATEYGMNEEEIYNYWLTAELSDISLSGEKHTKIMQAIDLIKKHDDLKIDLKQNITRTKELEKKITDLAKLSAGSAMNDFERLMNAGQWTLYLPEEPPIENYYAFVATFLKEITTTLTLNDISSQPCPQSDMQLADYLSGRVHYDANGKYINGSDAPSHNALSRILLDLSDLLQSQDLKAMPNSMARAI